MSLPNKHRRQGAARRGITLLELMLAVSVLALVAGALAALTQAVRVANGYAQSTSTVAQHARVVLHRIGSAVADSHANESFPGAVVFAESIAPYEYPDALVIWRPDGDPADADGLPSFSEIVLFCPNPGAPNELLEITSPDDVRTVPAIDDSAAWLSELANLKTGSSSRKVLLTDLLHTAAPSGAPATQRGAVRFAVELRPSAAAWESFRTGWLPFDELPWAQSIYGSQSGLRQTWVSSELQLTAQPNAAAASQVLPFFGSSASYWQLQQ